MTETKQEVFSFDEIVDDGFWSVADVRENDTVTPIKNKEGNCIEVRTVDFAKKGETPDEKQIYLMNCNIQNQELRLKLPKKTMLNLKRVCNGDMSKLLTQKFKIHIEGEGNFRFIALLLS